MAEGTPPLEDPNLQPPSIAIDWQIPNDVHSRYATNLVVQAGPNEFIISFFEIRPPILLGTQAEKQAALENIKTIPAICVARIVVSPAQMPEFIRVLTENWERTQSAVEDQAELK